MIPPRDINGTDHYQSPPSALDPILPYLPKHKVIWEIAQGEGNFTRYLRDKGYTIIGTDILEGVDFLDRGTWGQSPTILDADIIITNPPYSLKDEFIAQCYELGKPFALLMPLTALEGIKRQALYKRYGVDLIFFTKRVKYTRPDLDTRDSSPSFASAWYLHNLLPKTCPMSTMWFWDGEINYEYGRIQ